MLATLIRSRGSLVAAFAGTIVLAGLAQASSAGAFVGAPPAAPGLVGGTHVSLIASTSGAWGDGMMTDGKGHLFFTAYDGSGTCDVFRSNMDGSAQITIATIPLCSHNVADVAMGPDGKVWYGPGQNGEIYSMNIDGSSVHTVATVPGGLNAFAFDSLGHLFGGSLASGQFVRMNLDGSGQTIISTGDYTYGMTVDHSGHAYLPLGAGGKMNLNGTGATVIFSGGNTLEGATTIPDGHVLWTDFGANRMYLTNSDGSNPFILSSATSEPEQAIVDPTTGTVTFSSWDSHVYQLQESPYASAGPSSATVRWTASTSPDAPVISYTVIALPQDNSISFEQTVPADALSSTFYGLSNGVNYQFEVYATNAFGDSPMSALTNPVTPGAQYPGAVTTPTVSGIGGAVKVAWVPGGNNGATVSGYVVSLYRASNLAPAGRISVPGSATTATVSGLTNGVTYRAIVTAINSVGVSDGSPLSNAVDAAGVPTWPAGAPVATALSKSAKVSWLAAHANGSAITGYKVIASPSSKSCVTSGALSCTVVGLTPSVTYQFKVVATNHIGASAPSPTSNAVVVKS